MRSKHSRLTSIAKNLKQNGSDIDAELILDAARALQDACIIADSVKDIVPAKFVEKISSTIGNATIGIRNFRVKCVHDWDTQEGEESNCKKCGCWRMGNSW